jgi:hypothetical protein
MGFDGKMGREVRYCYLECGLFVLLIFVEIGMVFVACFGCALFARRGDRAASALLTRQSTTHD